MDFLNSINLESVIADPMLMMGIFLLIVGPLFFLVALWKLIRFKDPDPNHFVIPEQPKIEIEPTQTLPPKNIPVETTDVKPQIEIKEPSMPELPQKTPVPVEANIAHSMEQTVVMPSGMADVQAQIDILVSQIKQLNKKSIDLEQSLEGLVRQVASKVEMNELKEVPMNPEDFIQKLLKLAEHVIALEKEMAKIKMQLPSAKAPIMPL